MKTFEELTEVFHSINEMEKIFREVVILLCHQKEIEQFTVLKNRVFDILVKDIHRNEEVCNEEVCNEEVCNEEVCNEEVCNEDLINCLNCEHCY